MNGLNFTHPWHQEPEILEVTKSLESRVNLRDQLIAEAAMKVTLRKQDEQNAELLDKAWKETVGP